MPTIKFSENEVEIVQDSKCFLTLTRSEGQITAQESQSGIATTGATSTKRGPVSKVTPNVDSNWIQSKLSSLGCSEPQIADVQKYFQ